MKEDDDGYVAVVDGVVYLGSAYEIVAVVVGGGGDDDDDYSLKVPFVAGVPDKIPPLPVGVSWSCYHDTDWSLHNFFLKSVRLG